MAIIIKIHNRSRSSVKLESILLNAWDSGLGLQFLNLSKLDSIWLFYCLRDL